MATSSWRALRLEPTREHDTADAAAAVVHDPLWFLTRQWQLGELQGENASTPVKVEMAVRERTISHAVADPQITPAEAIVESERDDWWTLGRRIRVGRALAGVHAVPDGCRFGSLAAPYEASSGAPDGRALWRARAELGIPDADFAGVAPDLEPAWNAADLWYEQQSAFTAPGVDLDVVRHGGGRVDWYTVDARPGAPAPPIDPRPLVALPTRLAYPGMPTTGLWEIEDADDDIGAIAPDSSHSPTAIMTELFFSSRDEWFTVPVPGRAGSILSIDAVSVTDAFGEVYTSGGEPGLRPPLTAGGAPWTLYRTEGLEPHELVLWHVAELPLESEPVERVQFGIDETANLLWAVERRLDGRDAAADPPPVPSGSRSLVPPPPGDMEAAVVYRYVPGEGAAPHWIPYELDIEGSGARSFVQRRLVDLSVAPALPMDAARAEVLQGAGEAHRIAAASAPSGGMELERRWQLARDMDGGPVLWIQRRRRQLIAAPARTLLFDVAEPADAPPEE